MLKQFLLLALSLLALSACGSTSTSSEASIPTVTVEAGRAQFINSYADWWSTWRRNAPIVNRLKAEFGEQIVFVDLDIDDRSLNGIRQSYGISDRSQYLLVDENNTVIQWWFGPLSEADVQNALTNFLAQEGG